MQYPPEFGPLAAVTPGTPGGLHGDAGRVRHALAWRGARARHRAWPTATRSSADRRHDRAREGRDRASGRTRRPSCCRTRARRARRRTRARSSARPTSRRRCASWSRPSGRRSRPARAARTRSARPTTASTAATSRRSSSAAHASRAGCTPSRTSRKWKSTSKSRSSTDYSGIEVYKLDAWTQGPVLLQSLNILENVDLQVDGLQQRRSTSTPLYQAMNLAFADRDFYYGDTDVPAGGAGRGLLSKDYAQGARERRSTRAQNDPASAPGRSVSVPGTAPTRIRRSCERAATLGPRAGSDPTAGAANDAPSIVRARASRAARRRFRRGRRGRLGGVGDAKRRLDSGGDRRAHRHRHEPAHAKLRARSRRRTRST